MTTGTELWSRYKDYTRDFTEHGRKLGFAGAAVCWLFKGADFTFPVPIYGALAWFVAYFLADALQSLLGAFMTKRFAEHHERKQYEKDGTIIFKVDIPRWLDAPAFTCFCIKAIALVAGFSWIGFELFVRIF